MSKRLQIEALREKGIPEKAIELLMPYMQDRCSENNFLQTRGSHNNKKYPPAIMLANTKFIKEIVLEFSRRYNGARIEGIYQLEYSIYAYNDDNEHWFSYARDKAKFLSKNEDHFAFVLEFMIEGKIYTVSLLCNPNYTNMPGQGYYSERRTYLRTVLTPEIYEFSQNPELAKQIVVEEFIKHCREAVNG